MLFVPNDTTNMSESRTKSQRAAMNAGSSKNGAKNKIFRPSTASTSSSSSSGSSISSTTELIRSNIIGNRCLIPSPFGQRKNEVVYADYTASGRALQFVEDFMTKVVAPTYANTHTEASATGSQTTFFRNEAREIIKEAVNAPSDDYVVLFTGSGSTGAIEKLFRVLGIGISEFSEKKWNLSKAIPDSERPVVFISHFEHHSNELIWRESIARCIVIREGE
jgi:selenocysteine lyase/cysteine desulfurase